MIAHLLRHGDTGHTGLRGRLDDPLTPAGWAQLRAATATPPPAPWQIVVSSPLRRCAEFAQELATAHGLPLEIDARLRELHFGAWEGADVNALLQEEPDALQRFWDDPWRYPPPQGERLEDFEQRLCTAWRDIAARHAGRQVLIVTHGGVIRLLLCLARNLPRSELLKLEVPHASLHRLAGTDLVTV